MKNTLIGILLLVSVGSLTFGFIQKGKADEAQSLCASEKVELENRARDQQLRASEFQKMAEQAHAEAVVQRTICEEQLKALKK
jgi:hypothetical protein